jgi:hypothetical protein
MHKCNLCDKTFNYKSKLEEHKNNKIPCNKKKESYNCELCNINFNYKSRLDSHKQSKKHNNIEKQYIIDNSVHIDNSNNTTIENQYNINVTVKYGFSETNIDILQLEDIKKLLIYEDEIHKFIKDFTEYPDEIYGDSQYLVYIFKFFIKIFAKLNFNLAYSENHNCIIYQFIKSNSKYIEYQLLEIDNNKFNYNTKYIDYKSFIEQFINLMKRVSNKFENETKLSDSQERSAAHTLMYILKYVDRYNKMLFTSENTKLEIENELLVQYTKFEESKNRLETEDEIFKKDLAYARANAFKNDIRVLNSLR